MKSVAMFALLFAALSQGKTLLLLPVDGDLEKSEDLSTIQDLYREAIENAYQGELKYPADSAVRCGQRECALALAGEAKADEVIFTNLKRLGEKWIFSSTLMEAGGGNAFNQRATAQNLEDLEPVSRRVAEALMARKSLEQVASVDNITGKEEGSEPVRRRSLYSGGLSLGYLYPMGDTYKLHQGAGDFSVYDQLVHVKWLNTWEFRDNLMVGFEPFYAAPHVFGADLNMQYMYRRTDFTPFVGGGVGIHAVGGDHAESNHHYSGPAVNLQAGVMLFRTYDIHVMARGQYQMVFNSDLDNGPSFDVGVVYQNSRKRQGDGGIWRQLLIGGLVLLVVGALN